MIEGVLIEELQKLRKKISEIEEKNADFSLWEKWKAFSQIFSAIAVPVVIAVFSTIATGSVTMATKEKDTDLKVLEISMTILQKDPKETGKPLREWALNVVDAKSPVKIPVELRKEIVEARSIPTGFVQPGKNYEKPHYTLALDWFPSFCERRPEDAIECQAASVAEYPRKNLTLHGLWTLSSYCNPGGMAENTGSFKDYSPIILSDALTSELKHVLPGMLIAYERHLWHKFGSCTGVTPEQYFRTSVDLTKAFSTTRTNKIIGDNAGKSVKAKDICQAIRFDFGDKADGVEINIGREHTLQGLRFHLLPDISGNLALDPYHLANIYANDICRERNDVNIKIPAFTQNGK